ncbi:flagellin [Priestia megaterium NCT-2]|uniref:flagellin N-terminal helical domain-containing protein n=1 Tax=Priestia megaterium TaxID=1404 RepID=UPI0003483BD3|nr:flagellin [Priestia megaterium]AYE52437.1 flagellin [Priestia megaterium NCT-2]
MIQTAEGALNETHDILQRMRELSTQASNGTATDEDRVAMQDELNQLTSEVNRIGNTTEFNTQKLLNGGVGSNDGSKLTKATSATLTSDTAVTATSITAGKITVDGLTFDLANTDISDGAATPAFSGTKAVTNLGNVTAGGTKLSDLVDITETSGKFTFTAKSSGSTSTIKFDASGATALGITGTNPTVSQGASSTIERHGIEGSTALGASADATLAAGSSIEIVVGNESAVKVNLNSDAVSKVYKTNTGTDENVKKTEMDSFIKDLNAALQQSGLSDKVTASLSKDNKVQFLSETGKDIKLQNASSGVETALGITVASDTVKNVNQVVGPGVQGSGYNTKFQIGANTGQSMYLSINDMRSAALGVTGNAGQAGFTKSNSVTNGTNDIKAEAALNISNKEDAAKSIEVIDKAIASVSSERGKLGAVQNRLDHTINNLSTSSENLTAAESRIRDVDYALVA